MTLLYRGQGQRVRAQLVKFTYADLPTGVYVPLITLPLGAVMVGGDVRKTIASNAGTTDVLDVGTVASGNAYLNDTDFKTAARVAFTALANAPLTAETTVGITRTEVGTAATAGTGYLYVEYVIEGAQDFNQD